MHILKNNSPIPLGRDMGTLAPGEWLMQDTNAFEAALMAERGSVTISYYEKSRVNPEWLAMGPGPDVYVRRILIIRSGAIGDLLLMSPALAAFRSKWPDADIHLCCFDKHKPVIQVFPVDGMGGYPPPNPVQDTYDLIIPLENIIETETELHATDAFAKALGVTVTDYRPVYRVTEEERILAKDTYPGLPDNPRVALHLCSSSRLRNYPLPLWNEVIIELVKRGWEVMVFASKGQIPPFRNAPDAVKDCTHLTFREAAAVLATCDVFCGVDSSFFNLCPALGVPAVGLFGPVDWRLRVKDESGQRALHTDAPCAPCGWMQSRGGKQWPEHGPCAKVHYCVPLSEIKPERVVAVIEKEGK